MSIDSTRQAQQDSPLGLEVPLGEGAIAYRDVLGGIIRDYYRAAAQPQIYFETLRQSGPALRVLKIIRTDCWQSRLSLIEQYGYNHKQ
jgi:hypothetical protein